MKLQVISGIYLKNRFIVGLFYGALARDSQGFNLDRKIRAKNTISWAKS